jgi:hypothetical protein
MRLQGGRAVRGASGNAFAPEVVWVKKHYCGRACTPGPERRPRTIREAIMIIMVQHTVRDYDAWKRVFDEHEAVRKEHGATGHQLYR